MSAGASHRAVVGSADRESGGGRLELIRVTTAEGAGSASVTDSVATGPVGFIATHPRLPILYATTEDGGGGILTAYSWTEEGELLPGGDRRSTGRASHVHVSEDGRHVLTADYGTSSVSLFRLDPEGAIIGQADELVFEGSGPSPRQDRPHPHQVLQVGDSYLVPDLGTDLVRRIAITSEGSLRELDRFELPAGSGPRHAVVADDLLYVACELSGEVRWDALDAPTGFASGIPSSRTGAAEVMPSAIRVVDGRVLVANRGPGTILDARSTERGLVDAREFAPGGTWPRDFIVSDDVLLIADNRADAVNVVSARDPHEVLAVHPVPGPTCVVLIEHSGG